MGRLLGLDYGTKRIGIAVSDDSQRIAVPYEVVATETLLPVLDVILSEEQISGIVIGLPTSLGGEEGSSAQAARALAAEVEAHTGLEVVLADERYTTKVVERSLIQRGMRRDKRRNVRDKLAATVMLQAHLDSLR